MKKDSQGTKKKAEEDLKRKARADRFFHVYFTLILYLKRRVKFLTDFFIFHPIRFGVLDNTEEEAKKKARLARFGKDTKVDSAEDDKRKARALRYLILVLEVFLK